MSGRVPQQTSPFVPLKRAHLATRALLDRAFSTKGITLAQFSALRILEDDPGISGAELARRAGVTAPTMNEIVGCLERAGLIERVAEGRGLLASLTAAGHDAIAGCMPMLYEVRAAVFGVIDPDRLIDVMAALDEIADAADSFDEDSLY